MSMSFTNEINHQTQNDRPAISIADLGIPTINSTQQTLLGKVSLGI